MWAGWPDYPSNSEVAHGVGLIPVSVAGEGVQVGGGVEQKEEKSGLPRCDVACGWNVFENARRRHPKLEPRAKRTNVHAKNMS